MSCVDNLIRSRASIASGTLAHAYLKNKLLHLNEQIAAELYQADARLSEDIHRKLREIEDDFMEGYDPRAFVRELPSLQGVDDRVREQLLTIVEQEYHRRFCPEERRAKLRKLAEAFLKTFRAWLAEVTSSGVNPRSARLWKRLRNAASSLRKFLEDAELSKRWIP